MELNITALWAEIAPRDYSASVAEIGNDAGPATWRAACDDAADLNILDTDEKREAFRAFVLSSGGWNEAEISAWTDTELSALCLQWIAGDIREGSDCTGSTDGFDWTEYEKQCEAGNASSRLFRADDSAIYWTMD